MSGVFNKLRTRQTACNDIIDEFTSLIRSGQIKVNDKLPSERELAEQFGVGRSTLREALKSMTVMGLLEAKQGEGTFVRNIDSDSIKQQLQWSFYLNPAPIQELIELRELIELKTVKQAAANRSEIDLVKIAKTNEMMEQTINNYQESKKYDAQFHMLIAEASGNKLIYNLLELTRLQLEEWFGIVLKDQANAQKTIEEHQAIFKAIENKDAQLAEKMMKIHLRHGVERLAKGSQTLAHEDLLKRVEG